MPMVSSLDICGGVHASESVPPSTILSTALLQTLILEVSLFNVTLYLSLLLVIAANTLHLV